MKKYSSIITFLLIVFAIYWSFEEMMPNYKPDLDQEESEFSVDRALIHVQNISREPHAVGFKAHEEVRNYLISELEKLSLEPQIQKGHTAGDWGNFSQAINVMAKIEGSGTGKALMLLAHYDSSPHSSLGASDDGSGIATILEGLRAYLKKGDTPVNDIIVLFTDAEELGLNGADLFANEHPWVKDVGLILNFEARGSGGPGYMFIETNRGNSKLIEEFIEAHPEYPLANSLYYSVYKLLPNDTDLTVFRENRDIDGFNFAFIDDHYDYHTANDNFARMDRNSLAHQASYLMPLLGHFSQSDLSDLKSLNDEVFFDLPFYDIVSYPFDWIWPMFFLTVAFFIALSVYGWRKKRLSLKGVGSGFLAALVVLVINGIIGFYGWKLILKLYPQYEDILQGFTYNGYFYIAAFTMLSIAVCFYVYHRVKNLNTADLLIGPIFIWLLVCGLVAYYLPGASYFIIPGIALLASLMIVMKQEKRDPYILFFLTLPAIWIFSPLIKAFPVGLGLKLIITNTILTTFLFLMLLPVINVYKSKKRWALLALVLSLGSFITAHMISDFSEDRPKPSSLLYVLNTDKKSAHWATYEKTPSFWTSQYIGDNRESPENSINETISSKYSTGFSYVSKAPLKPIAEPLIEKTRDTVIGNSRVLEVCITSERDINRLEIFTNDIPLESAIVNGIELDPYFLSRRRSGRLVTHYVSDNAYTELLLRFPKDSALDLTVYEASNDLLEHPQFTIPDRPANNIPMPFVLNDAVLLIKTVRFE